ncbi:hypothetical protein tb265_06410 [Gemmatimonadetes bacterium T265]|nr:hypothetical protein tb265_06410 [Gemmatimonadetes bacterium T265]
MPNAKTAGEGRGRRGIGAWWRGWGGRARSLERLATAALANPGAGGPDWRRALRIAPRLRRTASDA